MTTLAGKYGPSDPVSKEAAAGRLEAYARVVRASIEGRDGPLVAPVLRLSNEQLVALFAPQPLIALVKRPLDRPARACSPPKADA